MAAILEMRGITKTFPGVKALSDVNLVVEEGEIHAICGENGAGKSTLMKVLSGVHPAGSYDGDIVYKGEVRKFASIRDSEHLGIIIIHQELALAPQLSIAENIFLGNETAARRRDRLAAMLPPRPRSDGARSACANRRTRSITNIGVGKQQLVEIAKALAKDVKLLILDEPTASLNEADSAALLNLLLGFKAQGMTSIMISHKLNEIAKVADKITIIRDGSTVETLDCRKRADQRGPHHQGHGRARDDRPLSPARRADRRGAVPRRGLARRAPAACGPRGHQGRQPERAARRGRRHRRADGRRAHRTRDERVRPRLWPQHPRARRRWRAASSTSPRSRRRSRKGSPMSPRTARCWGWC